MVDVVRRAVDRVDDPEVLGVRVAGRALLADDAVVGEAGADLAGDVRLGVAVGGGDRIGLAGVLIADGERAAVVIEENLSGAASDLDRGEFERGGRDGLAWIGRRPGHGLAPHRAG